MKDKNQLLKDISYLIHDPFAINLLDIVDEQTQLLAVSINPSVIKVIINPSETVQLLAVHLIPENLKYIKNPTELVRAAASVKIQYTDY